MSLVATKDELFDNVESFLEALEMGEKSEIEKAISLVKKANTFLVIITDEVNVFVPSAFVAYNDLSINSFDPKFNKELEANDSISKLLGSSPKIDKTIDELFLDFCDEIEINRNDVGLSREYWIIKNL